MKDEVRSAAVHAALAMLRPVVRLLLAHGVGWKEFAELGKRAYVQVAGREYGLAGRPTNASRVAILSGLSRREVKKQRDLLAAPDPVEDATSSGGHATRLLSGWFLDPDFSRSGRPAALAREGDGASFAELHRRYGGDVPVSALLKELLKTRTVRETEAGLLEPLTRYWMPVRSDPAALLRAGSVAEDLGRTLGRNLLRGAAEPSTFEGRATNTRIPVERLPAFREFVEREGQALLERVDDWLTVNEQPGSESARTRTARVGLGIYQIQGNEEGSGT
jgi:hypothetical protein